MSSAVRALRVVAWGILPTDLLRRVTAAPIDSSWARVGSKSLSPMLPPRSLDQYACVALRDSLAQLRCPVNGYRRTGLLDETTPAALPGEATASATAARNVARLRNQKGWSLAYAAKAAN